jgi:hypothetical protein
MHNFMCVAFLDGLVARAFAHHLRTRIAAKCQTIVKHRVDNASIIFPLRMKLALDLEKFKKSMLLLFRREGRLMLPQIGAGLAQCSTNITFSMRS